MKAELYFIMRALVKTLIVGLVAVFGVAVTTFAQTPAPNPRDVMPERPTVATHAGTVATGIVEIETGVEVDHYDDESEGGLVPVVFKIGLAKRLQLSVQMPTMKIEVRGHTDSVDNDATNLALSNGRAASVVAHLVKSGIAAARLQSKGFGESSPIGSNTTDEGRKLNRRVEFVILSR